jgi:hypothetical protein
MSQPQQVCLDNNKNSYTNKNSYIEFFTVRIR